MSQQPLSPAQIAQYARQAGFPESEIPTAVAVAMAESSGRYWLSNTAGNTAGGTDLGLWQINSKWNPDSIAAGGGMGRVYDPAANAKMAFHAWKAHGWNDWVTYKKGLHKKYLTSANAIPAVDNAPQSPAAPTESGIAGGYSLTGISSIIRNGLSNFMAVLTAIAFILIGLWLVVQSDPRVQKAQKKLLDTATDIAPQTRGAKIALKAAK